MAQSLLKRQHWLHSRLTERRENGEEGFTLIELLIVLLIIGILLAIAIPTYLSVVGSASSNTALTNLQSAITAGDAIYVESGGFPNSGSAAANNSGMLSDLNNQGDGIDWMSSGTAVAVNTNQVGVLVINAGEVVYVAHGSGSTCYYVDDVKSGQAKYATTGTGTAATADGVGTYWGTTTTGSCIATNAGTATGWTNQSPSATTTT